MPCMKRDMDLIRNILLTVESDEHGFVPHKQIEIDGYTQEKIQYHSFLLGEAGLAEVSVTSHHQSESPSANIIRLTWQGHEFLDSARDREIWNQVKDAIGKVGGASIQIWIVLLTEYLKKKLGI
jgi:hypothetical protein